MEKYDLSAKQLETVLRKLVEADLIDHMQLYERHNPVRHSDNQGITSIPRLRLRNLIKRTFY